MSLLIQNEDLLRRLLAHPESGMGYQVVTVRLRDGREFRRVIVVDGRMSNRAGLWTPPFSEDDIVDVMVTHDRSGPPIEAS
jgi:hypothetical protein